jgi:5-methylcytosine-specific restriction enzyme subunit McrC
MSFVSYEPITAWTTAVRPMAPEHALELARQGVVKVSPVESPDLWQLESGSKVGILVGDGWDLRIRPKLDVPKLLFLLAYSSRPQGWRDLVADFSEAEELFDAVASGFSWHVTQAIEQGVLRGYVSIEERRQDLRGRVRFADQLARTPGMALPLEVSYDDFTADILENRLIASAGELLRRLPRIAPEARKRLLRARALLEDVSLLAPGAHLEPPIITRLNARYAPALALAMLVLRARSIDTEWGDLRSTTFLFDMNEVFESFVFSALEESFRRHGGALRPHVIAYLDVADVALKITPDITWWRGGECVALIDAKYKSLVDRRTMPNADAYQMVSYCIGFGLTKGYLIYAKDEETKTRSHVVKQHGYEIDVHAVDLEADPDVVLAQIDAIADAVAGVDARHPGSAGATRIAMALG